jgi:uncharacterized membrane-anchored protein
LKIARYAGWGFLVAFLVQAGLLGWLVADRALLLKNGKEVRLSVVPVDPRDLLRGDYVVLAYPISQLSAGALAGDDEFSTGDTIYVALERSGEEWYAVSLHGRRPESGLFLRGTVNDRFSLTGCTEAAPECLQYRVDYNLERFFVPEGTGRELESLRNDQRMSVDIAVADDGRAALKRLLVDGAVRYAEKLL